jgi:hypothetical protein
MLGVGGRTRSYTLKPEPWFMTACFSLPDCFLACKTTQELPVTQLARHVDLFHLIIADHHRPDSLSLPHGLAPPIKHTTHFSQAAAPWPWGTALRSGLINLPFPHVAWSLFGRTLQIWPCSSYSYPFVLLFWFFGWYLYLRVNLVDPSSVINRKVSVPTYHR